ncbi:purine-nucleoside phosphorylase [Paracoccus seriniphilus]|uniref:Purine nucleoside permease n=1 Tax=Paracoccus seriniphilus TaxID=184748 RepID=A0A239Q0D0_9RHOB|nr:purine nucleoside permease [Paracoccus seriniphilus]WCR13998.1 purine nucleoside permease [Paracoccus seriniphilus]SNT76031.1 Purine nucleoside permease [Paracoccus seriniphilus]
MKYTTALLTALLASPLAAMAQDVTAPKILVITMFDGETRPWLDNLDLSKTVAIAGLPESAPALSCNDDLCVMTTTMGFGNAASSVAAVALSDKVDLSGSYILIAGIAGVDPELGTLGSAHWARQVLDGGLMHYIDAREIPQDWASGWLKLGTSQPGQDGGWTAGTEVFALNADLAERAFQLTRDVELADSERAREYRAAYSQTAAQGDPFVSLCDTVSADTYWHGKIAAEMIENHVAQLSAGKAEYCTSQMEDNATLTALSRAATAGRVDLDRIAVLRTASNFDRQHDGQTAAESLGANSGGFGPATENAFRVGNTFAQAVIANWDDWKDGVPAK